MFWGSVQQVFNGFAHNPVKSRTHVRRPTLLMLGSRDNRVLMSEGRAIFDALAEKKHFEIFEGLGHESLLKGKRDHG